MEAPEQHLNLYPLFIFAAIGFLIYIVYSKNRGLFGDTIRFIAEGILVSIFFLMIASFIIFFLAFGDYMNTFEHILLIIIVTGAGFYYVWRKPKWKKIRLERKERSKSNLNNP